ncbi:MAG: hypothetical protein WCO60_15435 [Verrucomicrobiota bacterium]
MNEIEINQRASEVTSEITSGLQGGLYEGIQGTLRILWDTKELNAWAESTYINNKQANHKITIGYKLAQQLYGISKEYQRFMQLNQDCETFKDSFSYLNTIPKLPKFDSIDSSIENMFLGGLTWVYFHELGHLTQEHQYIRNKFSTNKSTSPHIEESFSKSYNPPQGKDAAISHATEFAADHEAVSYCLGELFRHFIPREEIENNAITANSRSEFLNTLFLFVCGLSCTMYLFHGVDTRELTKLPEGSHPEPIRRLEACIPQLIETLDLFSQSISSLKINRKEIANLCIGAAHSFGYFWRSRNGNPNTEIINGILQDPHLCSYWGEVIAAWDEIEPFIVSIRWFGTNLGLLQFTDTIRHKIYNNQQPENTN